LSPSFREDIRNITIVAHVDHGKTSLVDAMLKQSKVFRENQQVGDLIMDRNALEREKGITILAKNTAVVYRDIKINIIDTPGHADFSGEVERVVNMADGCLLLVDSVEGPMPQTRFVLRQAFAKGLKPILVINKIDRENSRLEEVLHLTQDLFLELASDSDQLDFPVLYTSARNGTCTTDPAVDGENMVPLFEAILKHVPPPAIEEGSFRLLVSNLDYDSYKGRYAIGRVLRGSVRPKDTVAVIGADGDPRKYEVDDVFTFMGLSRLPVEEATAGEIISITGLEAVSIGDTVTDPEQLEALPRIKIGEPTVKMTVGVNGSPFAGREGKYCTSRQLRERLYRELETNISLRVEETGSPDLFLVSGRGELHLAILVETMRRQDYEFEISRPEAITRESGGQLLEPLETLTLDTREEYIGVITELLSKRLARMTDMHNDGKGNVRMEFRVPTRGLIGFRSAFLTATRGDGVMNTLFLGYEPWAGEINSARSGALVAAEDGTAVTYGLNNAQERGITFIDPGTQVYEGMIVGLHARGNDLAVNVCKEKKQTNIRASTADIAVRLTPPLKMSLEESMDFISGDELVEVTPKNIRLRKRLLTMNERFRAKKTVERGSREE
jgi:GTP-binding protein